MMRLLILASIAIAAVATGCGDDGHQVDQLALPGPSYFPESLHAAADGTLYVGSLGTGQIVRFHPGEVDPEVVVAASVDRNIAGVLFDDASASVLACTGRLAMFAQGNRVSRFAAAGGALLASYPLPDGAFCNDLAFDGAHNLYLADSIGGRIFKLPAGAADGTAPSVWLDHPLLHGPTAMELGADGITYDATAGFYVNNVTTGALVRIPIQASGEAGPVVEVVVTPSLNGPDGMRMLDATTLIVAEGPADRVSRVTITGATGQRTSVIDTIREPASVVVVGDDAWVIEGQILRLVSNPPATPELPFLVRRVPLR